MIQASKKVKILICHPGRQHSHQAALALQKGEMLAGYWTGIPCFSEHRGWIPSSVYRRFIRYSNVPLDKELVHWFPAAPLMNKLSNIFPQSFAMCGEYFGYTLFDRWTARQLIKQNVSAVIAYENSALETFKMAKRLGVTTILDAASIHHRVQDKASPYVETTSLHHRIVKNKDQELQLADHILTTSELARQTYLENGISADRIHVLPLGTDTDLFVPFEEDTTRHSKSQFTFIFSGKVTFLKGVDILVEAYKQVSAYHKDFRLKFIGPLGDAGYLLKEQKGNSITWMGTMSQDELVKEYQGADCLILPSRYDSYGMVVAEALACGVPVIISDMVGTKKLVTEGKNGWVVRSGNAQALAERMLWCLENQNIVREMRKNARLSAMKASWVTYHQRLIDLIEKIVRPMESGVKSYG